MASWNIPALINKISEDVPAIKALLTALFKWTDADTTDVPVGAKRLQEVAGGKQMQEYSGSSWGNVGKLMHDVDMLDGKHASTAQTADTIPVRDANGTIPGNISGNAATATEASSLASGYTTPVANGGTGATTEAGARASLGADNASNISSGILDIAYGGTGSSQKNFVDLTENQNVGGTKTFSSEIKSTAGTFVSGVMTGVSNADTTRGQRSVKNIGTIDDKDGKCFASVQAEANTDGSRSIYFLMRNRADNGWPMDLKLKELADGTVQTLAKTPPAAANDTQIATTAWVRSATGNTSLNAATATSAGTCTGNAATATKQACVVSANGNYADVVNVTDGTKRVGTIRITNGNGFTEMLLGVHNESNGAPGGLNIRSTNGTVTASLNGDLTATKFSGPLTGNVTGNCSGSSGSCTGNAATATKAAQLTTARKINGVAFNGTADITVADSTKVAKAGDTMTGPLNLKTNSGNAIRFYDTGATKGTAPSGDRYHYIEFFDKNGKRMGWVGSVYYKNKGTRIVLTARKSNAAGDTAEAGVGVHVAADGTAVGFAPTPPAGSNTTDLPTTAWVRGRLGNGEFGMKPNYPSNYWRNGNTTYTAGTNGYLIIHGSSDVNVAGAEMHNTYWSYASHQNKSIMYPIAKGQTFWTNTGCWFVPAM